jgi:hypothetical protein
MYPAIIASHTQASLVHPDDRRVTNGRFDTLLTSSGIGYELAKLCAENGYDLLVAADQPEMKEMAQTFRQLGVEVEHATEAI